MAALLANPLGQLQQILLYHVIAGEVLAAVNQPSFNPNNRSKMRSSQYRNRAVTDVFEPGSVMKPFVVAAALGEKPATGRHRHQHHQQWPQQVKVQDAFHHRFV